MDTSILIAAIAVVVFALIVGFFFWRGRPDRPTTDTVSAEPETARSPLASAIRRALGSGVAEGTWEEIEAALLAADVGVESTDHIMRSVRDARPQTVDEARTALREALRAELLEADRAIDLAGSPASIVVVGVNGTGKTTTIAKLAKRLQDEGNSVVLGAADTFRAAAAEQLQTWGERVGAPVVRGQEGGDPASVAYDALESARAKGADVVIIDTAGRLHGKKNLMAELQKIHRVAGGEAVSEVLLVLDATAGQNGLAQVREFSNAIPITGIALTKLDGTARGGIVIAVEGSLGVPVKLIGVGEGLGDLVDFDPDSFVDSVIE